ncbi:MAG: DNA cytosine methyltransferase [Limisphaerales bacterium]
MSSRGNHSSLRPTAISLFAGAGGCSLGFGQAGCDVRSSTDLDADAVESCRRKFPGTPCAAAELTADRGRTEPE